MDERKYERCKVTFDFIEQKRETDWAKNSHMKAKFEVKKAAIEIRYIDFQIYICYNAYRQERIIV